jgi:deoxyadenosine/deoxycytidine kinase
LRQTQKLVDEDKAIEQDEIVKDKASPIDVYITLGKTFIDMKKLVGEFGIQDSVLLDSIIDKMSFEELQGVLTNPDNPHDFGLYNSLKTSDIVIVDAKGKPTHVYNHLDGSFYSITPSILKRVGPLEQAKISKNISLVEEKVKYTNEAYKGSIEFSKKNEPNFKIKDNAKTKGFVCHQTSSLTIEDLKKRLNEILPVSHQMSKDTKYTKRTLCDVYELMLRSKGPGLFKRAYHKKIE